MKRRLRAAARGFCIIDCVLQSHLIRFPYKRSLEDWSELTVKTSILRISAVRLEVVCTELE